MSKNSRFHKIHQPVTKPAPLVQVQFISSRLFQLFQFVRFYWQAITKYQIHSPFVFEFVSEVLEDRRLYYAYFDIERLRKGMLKSSKSLEVQDFGAGPNASLSASNQPQIRTVPLKKIAQHSGSTPRQGRRLFRLAKWLKPKHVLEMGTSLGIGTMYLASGLRNTSTVWTMEGCQNCAEVARIHFDIMKLRVNVITGSFDEQLPSVLEAIDSTDMVFFDGNHRANATLDYFEQCLLRSNLQSVFVFDDIHWSKEMLNAWKTIQNHPKVTLSIDCWDFGCIFFMPDFAQKQHLSVVPWSWKPWKVF